MSEGPELRYTSDVADPEVYPFVAEGFSEAAQEGLSDPLWAMGPVEKDQAIYVIQNEEVLSCLVYRADTAGYVRLVMIYTEPSSRRKGHATALINDLFKRFGPTRFRVACSSTNIPFIKLMEAVGIFCVSYIFEGEGDVGAEA